MTDKANADDDFPPPPRVDPAAFYDVIEGSRQDDPAETLLGSSGIVKIQESADKKSSDG